MLTKQQIFYHGLNHIRKQGVQCLKERGKPLEGMGCAYRNEAGQSCIVGGFITAELYRPVFDNSTNSGVTALLRAHSAFRDALDAAGIDTADPAIVDLLGGMQSCHDRTDMCPDDWLSGFEARMARLAVEQNLTYTPPPKA